MTSQVDKAKKLKYLGVQFITIDDPVLEQTRLSLNCQRNNNNSGSKLNTTSLKPNNDTLQPYPGLENSNELFTHDEISEINYCVSLGSNSNSVSRFKPTSKLSLLKQVSQTIHEKNDYNQSVAQEKVDDSNLFEISNNNNTDELRQAKPPSTPLTRCDSLISCNGDDETNFLQVSERRSQLTTPANGQPYNEFPENRKEGQSAILSQGEIQNQIWTYTHDTSVPNMLDNLDEYRQGNISTYQSIKSKTEKRSNEVNTDKNNQYNKLKNNAARNNDVSLNTTNDSLNNDKCNIKPILNKSQNCPNKKTNQTPKSSIQEQTYAYTNGIHVQPINGSIVNGKTQLNLNSGEKRLKRIIAISSPKESISSEFNTPSILKKSYCARRVHEYLKDSAMPLPTFLHGDSDDLSD